VIGRSSDRPIAEPAPLRGQRLQGRSGSRRGGRSPASHQERGLHWPDHLSVNRPLADSLRARRPTGGLVRSGISPVVRGSATGLSLGAAVLHRRSARRSAFGSVLSGTGWRREVHPGPRRRNRDDPGSGWLRPVWFWGVRRGLRAALL